MSEPLVSISCITYNHAPFIKQCLDSFLCQNTRFTFEIIIHDDCSTDGTREIIEAYVAKYPDIIFPYYQAENQYSKGIRGINARFNFPRCSGKYIALCEGDDYWMDPLKLQKQADFLDEHTDFILCGHDVTLIDFEGKILRDGILINKKDCSSEELQKCHPVLTQTMFFRNVEIIKNMPEETFKASNGDRFLVSILGQYGKYKFMHDVRHSAYRIHQAGVWSKVHTSGQNKMMAITYSNLRNYYYRTKNKKIAFFHSRKTLFYSKRVLLHELFVEKTIKKKIDSIIFFIKINKIVSSPILFITILSSSLFKRIKL